MAWIEYVPYDEVDPAHQVDDRDHIIQVHGVHSAVLRLHYDLYRELMYSRGPLTRVQREMIAVAVSARNACRYWTVHHGAGLRRLLTAKKMDAADQDALVAAIEAGDAASELLDPTERAILGYALKLTSTPQEMAATDVAALRAAGLDDRGIHDVCAIAGYFGFVNRMADGLGVELENR